MRQEQIINGVYSYKDYPDEPWRPYSIETLSARLVTAQTTAEDFKQLYLEYLQFFKDVKAIVDGKTL